MFKRVTATIFLFVFLYNAVGYYLVFKIEQFHIKQIVELRIEQGLPLKEIRCLTFQSQTEAENKIVWMDKKEFRYQGSMYDLVKETVDADGCINYYCKIDEQEDLLFDELETYNSNEVLGLENSKNKNNSKSFKISEKDSFHEFQLVGVNNYIRSFDIIDLFVCESIVSKTLPVIPPPPKV